MPLPPPTPNIDGVIITPSDVHQDDRGSLVETYRAGVRPARCHTHFVQSNLVRRRGQCVVGMHFHRFQADLWTVIDGWMKVVLYDLRLTSDTTDNVMAFGMGPVDQPGGFTVFIPPGVAHGFSTGFGQGVTLSYLVDGVYDGHDEYGFAWDDPALCNPWDIERPRLSDRDLRAPRIAGLTPRELDFDHLEPY